MEVPRSISPGIALLSARTWVTRPVSVVGSVDGVNGKVNVFVSHVQTTALSTGGSDGFYEVIITSSGGLITTIAEGPLVFLTP